MKIASSIMTVFLRAVRVVNAHMLLIATALLIS